MENIKFSPEINQLAEALCEVHGKVSDASKDKQGHGYNYADLSQIIGISRELLHQHGLCIIQNPGEISTIVVTEIVKGKDANDPKAICYIEPGQYATPRMIVEKKLPVQKLHTIVMHKSGQWVSGEMQIIVEKTAAMSWAQATGSCISYGRRYSRSGSLGITQTDNDGSTDPTDPADQKGNGNGKPPTKQAAQPVSITQQKITSDDVPDPFVDPKKQAQLAEAESYTYERLAALINEMQVTNEEIHEWLKKAKIHNLNVLGYDKTKSTIQMLEKRRSWSDDQLNKFNEKKRMGNAAYAAVI